MGVVGARRRGRWRRRRVCWVVRRVRRSDGRARMGAAMAGAGFEVLRLVRLLRVDSR